MKQRLMKKSNFSPGPKKYLSLALIGMAVVYIVLLLSSTSNTSPPNKGRHEMERAKPDQYNQEVGHRLASLRPETARPEEEKRIQTHLDSMPIHCPRSRRSKVFLAIAVYPEYDWELFKAVAAESYGMYEGIVFYRDAEHLRRHNDALKLLFGVTKLAFIESYDTFVVMREVPVLWKSFGMTGSDIGLRGGFPSSDGLHQTYSRRSLKYLQDCDIFEAIDWREVLSIDGASCVANKGGELYMGWTGSCSSLPGDYYCGGVSGIDQDPGSVRVRGERYQGYNFLNFNVTKGKCNELSGVTSQLPVYYRSKVPVIAA